MGSCSLPPHPFLSFSLTFFHLHLELLNSLHIQYSITSIHWAGRQQLKLKTSIHITLSIYLFSVGTDLSNLYLNSQTAIMACMVTRIGFPQSRTRMSWENARKTKVHVFPSVHYSWSRFKISWICFLLLHYWLCVLIFPAAAVLWSISFLLRYMHIFPVFKTCLFHLLYVEFRH